MKKVIFLFFVIYIGLLTINRLSIYVIANHTSYETLFNIWVPSRSAILPWLNFDGKNYLTIVLFGYPSHDILSVFYPLYPLLVRILSLNLRLNPIIVGLFISYVSSLTACILFYKLVKLDYSSKIAFKSVFLLLIFPASFYLFSYYTEGLFLLISILTFWFIRKKNIFLASFFTALATATRITGLALIPVLLYEAFSHYKKTKKINLSIIISPLGFILYAIYTYVNFKNPFFMITAQTGQHFKRAIGLLSPYTEFREAITKIVAGPQSVYDNPFVYVVIILELLFAIYALIILILSYKKIHIDYWIYIFSSMVLIFFGGAFSSNIRYLLLIFPIYIFLGLSLSKKILIAWSVISLCLLLFASSLFLRGYWIS